MPAQLSSQHIHEIASAPRPLWSGYPDAERISDHIARSEGFAEASGGSWGRGVYSLFDDMEDKDPHLFSVLQTRKFGVLARQRKVEPASPSTTDRDIARWLDETLARLDNWDSGLMHLLGSLSKGMAVLEVIWGYDAQGRAVPIKLKPRNAGRFTIGPDDALYLDDDGLGLSAISSRVERGGAEGDENRPLRRLQGMGLSSNGQRRGDASAALSTPQALPDRKFIVMLFNATDERPYGRGLCERVYWYWWFKKTNTKFWVMFNEKFGAPTVVARHEPGLSPEERERLLEVISTLQADAGVTIPEGITLELLESNRRGSAETYQALAQWCNDEMSRAVLGQTLTVSEGSRSGSLALGKVHEEVRFDYIRTDACLLVEAINTQLIRWIIDFNFGEKFPAPRWTIDLSPEIDRQIEANIDRQLLQMGVPLPLRYFYEKYGRPTVGEGERQLRYDDSNLFQYHLQFGVLTVNEVRASLSLPPVSWGDGPTSPVDTRSSNPTSGDATGDGPLSESEAETREELRHDN